MFEFYRCHAREIGTPELYLGDILPEGMFTESHLMVRLLSIKVASPEWRKSYSGASSLQDRRHQQGQASSGVDRPGLSTAKGIVNHSAAVHTSL